MGILRKTIPDLKGICLYKDKTSILCNELNIFDNRIEKHEFSISPEYRNEDILVYHSTTVEIVHLFNI